MPIVVFHDYSGPPGHRALGLHLFAIVCMIIAAACTGAGSGVRVCDTRGGGCSDVSTRWPIGTWEDNYRNNDRWAGKFFVFAAELLCILLLAIILFHRYHFKFVYADRGIMMLVLVLSLLCGCLEAWYAAPGGAFKNFQTDSWIAASVFCFVTGALYFLDLFCGHVIY